MTVDEMKLAQEIKNAVSALSASERFPVPVLAVKASRAAQENPYDASLVTASNVLKKMASDNKMFITRQELNKLYDDLYSPTTKLAEVFAEELDRRPLDGPTMMQRSDFEERELSKDYEKIGDPLLLNALDAAFSGDKEARLYSVATANSAERSCQAELAAHGMTPKKVEVFAGQSDIIVCEASYDTPRGESHVLIPVEIKEGHALLPRLFLTQAGFMDISAEALEQHIKATAGRSYQIDGQKLLDVLATAKNGTVETTNEIELAAMQLRAQQERPHTPNGILYREIDNPIDEVKDVEVPKTPEHEAFEHRLASPAGIAKQVFGERVVEAGASMLQRKLAVFGFTNPQVRVSSVNDDTILYSVAVDHSAGFKVPVKVQHFDGLGLQVMEPSMIVASGHLAPFSQEGIGGLLKTARVDSRAMAEASPMYGMKPSELMAQVREAIAEGNMHKAEDAITVLGEIDPMAQKRAMELMFDSFSPDVLQKVASEQKGCCMVVHSSASQHPLCGHLNLPLHKVYQDKNGDCQPLYRRGMEETSEGGMFVTHRMLHY